MNKKSILAYIFVFVCLSALLSSCKIKDCGCPGTSELQQNQHQTPIA